MSKKVRFMSQGMYDILCPGNLSGKKDILGESSFFSEPASYALQLYEEPPLSEQSVKIGLVLVFLFSKGEGSYCLR